MNKKAKTIRDFDPIESKQKKKNKTDNRFDPSRKNKKYFLKNANEYL